MERKSRAFYILLFVLIGSCALFNTKSVFSQEGNYWLHQFGPTSTFLSGAVTGGVRDNSNIYYNPGAAAFTTNFNISIQTDAFYNENIYYKNGAGEGLSVQENTFEKYPQIFALTFGVKKRPNWRMSIGFLSHDFSNLRLTADNESESDIYPNLSGDEIYTGSWTYSNRLREDWYGIGLSRLIGQKFGLGLTAFTTYRSYDYVETHVQNLYYQPTPNNYESLNSINESVNLYGAATGLLAKIGLAYEWKEYKLGLTITTPRAQVNFIGSMDLNSSNLGYNNSIDTASYNNLALQYDDAVSTYKSPWIIDFGVMKTILKTDFYIRVAYYGKVDRYEIIRPNDQSEINNILYGDVGGAGTVQMAQKEVWNAAIGINKMFTKKFGMMMGFRTDFNTIDWNSLSSQPGLVPAISSWDLYHFSAGTKVTFLKQDFTVGFTYSTGRSSNIPALVNLSTPSSQEGFKAPENNASAYYDQINLTVGYIYNFNLE